MMSKSLTRLPSSSDNTDERIVKVRKAVVGKSIEEIMIKRNLSNGLPLNHRIQNDKSPVSVQTPSNTQKGILEGIAQVKEIDNRDHVLQSLMDYCRSLQNRIDELESLHISQNTAFNQANFNIYSNAIPKAVSTVEKLPAIRNSTPVNNNKKHVSTSSNASVPTMGSVDLPENVGDIIVGIDQRVFNLKELFRKGDPLEERRVACVKIQSVIRGFLSRNRLRQFRKGIMEWRWLRCRPVVFVLDILLANQSKLDAGFHLLKMNRNMKKIRVFYDKWAFITQQNNPLRRSVKAAAEEKINLKRMALLKITFEAMVSVLIGKSSTKHAIAERRKLMEQIRKDMTARYHSLGIIPEVEQHRELNRRLIIQFETRKNFLALKLVFTKGMKKMYSMAKKFMSIALFHRFKILVGRCFYSWSDHTYLVGLGLDRKRWNAPRKYEIRYNQKRVDNFSNVRVKRMIFGVWKVYFMIQMTVKRKFQKKCVDLAQRYFSSWAKLSKHQRRLRIMTYENWKGYARLIVYGPFYTWADFVKAIKNHHNEQARIANSYLRWKSRQKLLKIMKVWRHQAVFGRLDGLYTRQMLLKTLGEQKTLSNNLQKILADQTLELDECKTQVVDEVAKKQLLEDKIQQTAVEVTQMKFMNSHYEQEIRKLQEIIQSLATINPNQVGHILEMQPTFKFKDRNIDVRTAAEREMAQQGIDPTKTKQPVVITTAQKPEKPVDNIEAVPLLLNEESDKQEESDNKNITNKVKPKPIKKQEMTDELVDDQEINTNKTSSVINPNPVTIQTEGETNLTSEPIKLSPKPNSDVDNVVKVVSSLSESDRVLLMRCKWLLERYRDMEQFELMKEHSQNSMSLVVIKKQDAVSAELYQNKVKSKATDDGFQSTGNPDEFFKVRPRPELLTSGLLPNIDTTTISISSRPVTPGSPPMNLSSPSSTLKKSPSSSTLKKSFFKETNFPIPLPESDPVDIRPAFILIKFIDFLENGDMIAFSESDKRDWSKYVLKSDLPSGNSEILLDEELEEDENAITWRKSLMELRTRFPQAGNLSGKGTLLDSPKEVGLFSRILEMKNNLEDATKQQTEKYSQVTKLLTQTVVVESDTNSPIASSIYSSNLKLQENI